MIRDAGHFLHPFEPRIVAEKKDELRFMENKP
jgi:hypothetical protein